jgi:putative hydrolase of the HAD superfamily
VYCIVSFDAVLFDLDGTLIRRTQDVEGAYERAFDRVGVAPFGEPAALWQSLDGPPDPDDEVGYLGAGFARLAAQHGRRDVDPLALAEAFVGAVDNTQVAYEPGATAALTAARSAGAAGVITNGPERRQAEKVEAVSLAERVETVVYAGDLPRRKPHVGPFERALADLDASAERALYVGDSLAYDVAGAHNAGLQSAWLDDGDGPGDYTPEFVIESLADLPALLEGGERDG